MTAATPLFVGIMSGTSADGVDVAVVRIGPRPELLHFSEQPLPAKLRRAILRLAEPGFGEIDNTGALDRALGALYADAALTTIAVAGLQRRDIAAIGNHGQTIRHRPDGRHPFSIQIGCAATIAEQTGITVVSDFRRRDIASGGQGAPLVPFAHRQLFASPRESRAVLNLGGIANITWLGADGSVAGFDTGPANMLMDALIRHISHGEQSCDLDGRLAAAGSVCAALLERLLQHPFLQQPPPKSTGREQFGAEIVEQILNWPDISDADRMATASRFTVEAIAQSIRFLPNAPACWLCCGGGVRNGHLMRELQQRLSPASVETTASAGMEPQAVEAACFALLARQTLAGDANTLAAVTGASHNSCGGSITPGDNWQALLQQIPAWTR